uniref:Sulfotransferase n=1 Tax=Chenopodium quinoa TaxID=63459 RepID=A0A803LKL5_CHEQI
MVEPSKMNQNTTETIQSEEKAVLVSEEEVEQLKQCFPKANFMGSNQIQLIKIQDFWYPLFLFSNILTCQRHFLAQDTDLVVASFPKTGTTWLKSLLFSIVNRFVQPPSQSSLLSHNPHELVYDLETGVYGVDPKLPTPDQLNDLPSPRLLHSHMPYASLPKSIQDSSCIALNGPYFEHVLGYWKQSLEQPDKVLFLKYEDLKENPSVYLKKLAEFIGMPFSPQEENEGVIKEILELCSIDKLRELEINKNGNLNEFAQNKEFFRDGKVGGWTRYLSDPMVERMNKLMEQKFGESGLSFKF